MKKSIIKSLVFTCFCLIYTIQLNAQLANWTPVKSAKFPVNSSGQIHGQCRITQMKFHPTNPAKLYAVTSQGGLFFSSDTSNNWTVAPGTDAIALQFASVCVNPINNNTIYLGSGDPNYYSNGNGVYKSYNGGNSFVNSNTGMGNRLVVEIIMDPLDTNILVAATNLGIYKSVNGGTSWSLSTGTTSRRFTDLKAKLSPATRTLYASTIDSAFFLSTDFGSSWTQITSGIVLPAGVTNGNGCRIGLTPADTNDVFLLMVGVGGFLYKSNDAGLNFVSVKTASSPYLTYYDNLATSSGQGNYNIAICVDRVDTNKIWMQAHNTWYSSDGGVTWTQLTNWWAKCHTDMHELLKSPFNNNIIYSMNDGGIWTSNDGGNNWTPKCDGLFAYEVTSLCGKGSPTRRDFVNVGTQDNGELYCDSTGWYTIRGGDWYEPNISDYRPNGTSIYYTTRNVRRNTFNSGGVTYNLPHTVSRTLAFTRKNPNFAFRADTIVYITRDLLSTTPTWTSIYTLASTDLRPRDAHIAFADTNRVYILTDNGKVITSSNYLTATPTFTTYNLPSNSNSTGSITTICNDPNIVYVAVNNRVYRSSNAGATWTNITSNLPNLNFKKIISEEYYGDSELVFIAAGPAVYYKKVTDVNWTLYSTNMQRRKTIEDLSMFDDSTSQSLLRHSSYGRGTWETPFHNLRKFNAAFTATPTVGCPGLITQFTQVCTGSPVSYTWLFPGGTPATSTSPNPSVTYSSSGIYPVTLIAYNGANYDTCFKNNLINTFGDNLNLVQGFESGIFPPTNYSLFSSGASTPTWVQNNVVGGFGSSTRSMIFDNYNINSGGAYDDFITSVINLNGYDSVYMYFDRAYKVYGTTYKDSLKIMINNDCSSNFTNTIYTKTQTNLATVTGTGGSIFTPTAADWKRDTINLTPYLNQGIRLAFRNVGFFGQALYIDNINIIGRVKADAGIGGTKCLFDTINIGMPLHHALVNYSWTPTAGLNNPNISNPKASPSTTTIYTLTATHSISGISNTSNVTVNVSGNASSTVPTDGSFYFADHECTDALGWTHYFDDAATPGNFSDDKILLSIKKNGNNIGATGIAPFSLKTGSSSTSPLYVMYDTSSSYPNYVTNPSGWYMMKRYWEVNPTSQPSSDIEVKFYYTNPDFLSLQASPAAIAHDTNMYFYKINSNGIPYTTIDPSAPQDTSIAFATAYNSRGFWQYKYAPYSSDSTWSNGNFNSDKYAHYKIASFSGGGGGAGGGSGAGALPIELIDFTAKNTNKAIQVNWATATEINNRYFELFSSYDGINFASIHIQNSKAINGNSTKNLSYQYLDDRLFEKNTIYYRLKQFDLDGTASLSKIISVQLKSSNVDVLNVFPNPASNQIQIQFYATSIQPIILRIYNVSGQLIYTKNIQSVLGVNNETIETDKFPIGEYTYELDVNGNKQCNKLVINR